MRIPAGMRLPRTFGRYTLFDYIGKGGMAEIYLARLTMDVGFSRLLVIKQILLEYAENPAFLEMLIHEAKLAANLSHTNIVVVHELGREEGRLFIAMEYVEGLDLNALLRLCSEQKNPLPVEFAIYIVSAALRGLDYAHRRSDETGKVPLGIVHRDVSPSNILISFEGEVKVCDFGIAHANDLVTVEAAPPEDVNTRPLDDAIKGKAGYMSPEHARGDRIDARADVFAAGIVLWELLAGRRMYKQPLAGEGRSSLLEQARKAEIPPLPKRDLPDEEILQAIIRKALALDPEDRFPSAAAMLRELEAYVVESKRGASPLKLGEWMVANFGVELIKMRRMRERVAQALARGPALVITPIAEAPPLEIAPPSAVPSSLVALTVDLEESFPKQEITAPLPLPVRTEITAPVAKAIEVRASRSKPIILFLSAILALVLAVLLGKALGL